jgi:hypothetical protein
MQADAASVRVLPQDGCGLSISYGYGRERERRIRWIVVAPRIRPRWPPRPAPAGGVPTERRPHPWEESLRRPRTGSGSCTAVPSLARAEKRSGEPRSAPVSRRRRSGPRNRSRSLPVFRQAATWARRCGCTAAARGAGGLAAASVRRPTPLDRRHAEIGRGGPRTGRSPLGGGRGPDSADGRLISVPTVRDRSTVGQLSIAGLPRAPAEHLATGPGAPARTASAPAGKQATT